jgi:hypothetical protein
LQEDDFARSFIAPPQGIERSSYRAAINNRGLEQLRFVSEKLPAQAAATLPDVHPQLGDLVALAGALSNAVCSMAWADYSTTAQKAKVHLGLDLNRGIPAKFSLTTGTGDERPQVRRRLSPGPTGVMDRNYQGHRHFDLWQEQGLQFVCRIRAGTNKTCVETDAVPDGGPVFYEALGLWGTPKVSQTQRPVRVVGSRVGPKEYWVATSRDDLSGADVALV